MSLASSQIPEVRQQALSAKGRVPRTLSATKSSERENSPDRMESCNSNSQLVKSPVAVEKLLPPKFAKIKSRQDALRTTISGRRDIFYPPNFGCLGRKVSLSTATPGFVNKP